MIFGLIGACQPVHAQSSSPFKPPEEKLGLYVINSGSGLDTGCSYRSQGPLVINLEVPATMNPEQLKVDGTLLDPDKLIEKKVIGSTAKISFPIFDIDDKADMSGTGLQPEVDKIYFNDELIKTLSGFNNQWVNDSFVVDISKVKFNKTNQIKIEIDTANASEIWCMAVDWVSIEFDAAIPYVLAHGISSDASTWDDADASGVLTTMNKSGVLYSRFSTGANGSVAANAIDLKEQIKENLLDKVKSDKVHIIAHSKGGLDSQALAKLSPPDFEVLSLSTLSTPHLGSVVANLQLLQRLKVDEYRNQGLDPNGYAQKFVSLGLAGWASNNVGAGPQPPGLNDLTTQAATTGMIARIRGNVLNTYTIGADAGPQCTRDPNNGEIDPLADAARFGTRGYVYDALRLAYQIICNLSSAVMLETKTISGFFGSTSVLVYKSNKLPTKQPNDIVVGIHSANPGWGTPLRNDVFTNHSKVKNFVNVDMFLEHTIKLR